MIGLIPYIKLGIAALLPVLVSAIAYYLEKKTVFGESNQKLRQALIGVMFGILAIIGTEWGIPMNGAQVNCRDAAVLTAGLMFGAPAGIIAGLIGGIERWVAVAWGVGTFTRVACSVSTIIAGFYAAFLRRVMFENKKPTPLLALATGVVMEVFHLMMVFLTNMKTPTEAMTVVHACTTPMVIANGLSVMLTAGALTLIAKDPMQTKPSKTRISQTIQRWLLVTVILAFLATSLFVFGLQTRIAETQTDSLLERAVTDVADEIHDASDANMLSIAWRIAKEAERAEIGNIAIRYQVAEINIVDEHGYIIDSTEKDFLGFRMDSGVQSSEFLCLLDDKEESVQDYGPISYDVTVSRKYAGVRLEGGGFLQVGYDAEQFQKDIDAQVDGITNNRHVGETGYILIFDEQRHVVSAPKELQQTLTGVGTVELEVPDEHVTFELTLNGEPSFCRYKTAEGYYIVSVLPETEAMRMRNIALYVNTFMEILVFALLFGLIYMLIKRVVVNQIKSINRSLAKITAGDLEEVVDVRSNEEFASLSDDINSTVSTLKSYIAEASARIDKELEFAKNIQSSALPSVFPAFPKRKDFDIYADMDPAKEVGGDFYDFYLTKGDTLNFLVADVSGKGIPAAMFMMRAKTELKTLTEADAPLCDVFTHGNTALCEGNDAGMFVTAWQGSLDLETGDLKFVNAGHNPPLLRHGNGKFEYLRSRVGFVLAGMDGVQYKTQEAKLEPGDCIYLYTDGVTEATNKNNELYGEDRLLAAINAQEFSDMRELCRFVKADVEAFVGEAPQFDDITMVALKFIGTPPPPSIYCEEATLDDIPRVTEFVEQELEKLDCPMKAVIQINVAIDEIFSTIVRYGYAGSKGPVTVSLIAKEDHVVCVRFEDHGIPYNPLMKKDPDITLSAEERGIGGLGIYMVKKTMDDVLYKYEPESNILTLVKKIGG